MMFYSIMVFNSRVILRNFDFENTKVSWDINEYHYAITLNVTIIEVLIFMNIVIFKMTRLRITLIILLHIFNTISFSCALAGAFFNPEFNKFFIR